MKDVTTNLLGLVAMVWLVNAILSGLLGWTWAWKSFLLYLWPGIG